MKKIAFILFCVLMGVNLSATDFIRDYRAEQKGTHSLGLKLEGFRSPALLQYSYSPTSFGWDDPLIFSGPAFGFKGTFNYFYHIHPKARLGLGFVGGRDSYRIQIRLPDFSISNPDHSRYFLDHYYHHISFLGLNLSLNLDLPIWNRSYLHFTSSLSGVYLPNAHKIKEVSIVAKRPDDEVIQVFHGHFKRNEGLLIASILGCGYAYKIKENMRLQATLNVLISRENSIQTAEPFTFTDGSDEYPGDFRKQFLHAGFGLEMVYSLPNRPMK